MLFGFFPNTRLYGLLPLVVAAVLRANRRRDGHVVPLFRMIVLSALSRSFKVLIRRSVSPFPRWSRIGHSTCFMKWSAHNCLNFSLWSIVTGLVLILFGIRNSAAYVFKNSITLSVVAFRKNFASGQFVFWSIDTNKYFLVSGAFLNGPTKSTAILSL